MKIGVISDTHGLLRTQVSERLAGVDRILHAGDVGHPDVLTDLQAIAPVIAVRGNVDRGEWTRLLPPSQVVETPGGMLYVLHVLDDLDLDPAAARFRAVIYGHSHQPALTEKGGVLYLNPGSAGPRRFRLPVSMAFLEIQDGELSARLETIDS